MKKFLSALLAVLLVVTFCISAFAEEQPSEETTGTWPENAEPAMDMSLEEYGKIHGSAEEPIFDEVITQESYSPFVEDRTVFGTNDLQNISNRSKFPYAAIARISSHFRCGCSSQGTGFMVSAKGLMTAAHVLVCFDHQKTADSLTFYFGFNNYNDYYYKYDGGTTFWYGTNYNGGEWDYGYVKFKDRVGDYTGWFGCGVTTGKELEGETFYISGYVGDTLFSSSGKVNPYNEHVLNYQIDMIPGMSGSPVYAPDGVAIAVNAVQNSKTNYATRITGSMIQEMKNNGLF